MRRIPLLATALVVAAAAAGTALASPQAQSGPFITGNHAIGQPLTGNAGTWNTDSTASYTYQWQRCLAGGVSCSDIAGATEQTYTLGSDDVGNSIRLVVTATDGSGASAATSAATETINDRVQVLGAESSEVASVDATRLALPNRLFIDQLNLRPTAFTTRAPVIARIHISDLAGENVGGALVHVSGLPSTWATTRIEAISAATGWAWLRIFPTKKMPLTPGHQLGLVITARVPGTTADAGTSVRRVFQTPVH
jgi:hypothetical protein